MPSPKMRTGRNLALLCIGAITIALSMFGVTLRNKVMQFATRQQPPSSSIPAPQPKKPTATSAPPIASPDSSQIAQHPGTSDHEAELPDPQGWRMMKPYTGKWAGKMLDGQAMRLLNFELRESTSVEGGFSGFSEMVEIPMGGPAIPAYGKSQQNPLAAVMAAMDPNAVLWTGVPDQKGIPFRVDKSIGKSKCPMASLTITPFGSDQLLAEWKSNGCPNGEVMLTKVHN